MIGNLHLPPKAALIVGQHLSTPRGKPIAHHLPPLWSPALMARAPAAWLKVHELAPLYAEGATVTGFTDSVGTGFTVMGGTHTMRHNVLNGYSGLTMGVITGSGFQSSTMFPIGRFACFAVFRRDYADSAPSNYTDFYMAHGNSPTGTGAADSGNYVWGRGSGLSQTSTNGALAKSFYQCDVSPTATTVGTFFTISGGSRPGRVAWGKINGVQPAGYIGGVVTENSLHNNFVNKADSRIYLLYDTITPSFRPRGTLMEFIYFNYGITENDDIQIHDYLRRKYQHY